MTILELKEKKIDLQKRMQETINLGETEKRELNDEERKSLEDLKAEITEIDNQIAEEEKRNAEIANKNKKTNNNTRQMGKKKTLISMINDVINNRAFDEDVQNEQVEARAEMAKSGLAPKGQIVLRGIAATVAEHGQENVPEEKKALELQIRNKVVASAMGADWLGGLVGDVSIPKYSGSSVKWAGEVATAEAGDGTFSEVVLKPHRLTATVDISKQFLLQDSGDAEALLISDLAAAVAEKLDQTIFGNGAGDTNTPAGIFNAVVAEGALSTADYDSVLALEEAVELKNGSNFIFVMNPKVKYTLKGKQMASGLQMVYSGGEVDGYKAISSNSVVANGIACLNPKMLVIGQWGGTDILVDNFTKASEGMVRLVVNAYFDAKLRGDQIAKKIFE